MDSLQVRNAMDGTRIIKGFPITLYFVGLTSVLAVFSQFLPVLDWLCIDYSAITEQDEFWRLVTGHLVHSSISHAFWDITMFAILSAYLEMKNSKQLLLGLFTTSVCLSLFLVSPFAEIERYSGLSGVIYALLVLAYWEWQKKQSAFVSLTPVVLIAAKTVFEWRGNDAVFVSTGWEVFLEAHLIGLIAGTLLLLFLHLPQRIQQPLSVSIGALLLAGCSVGVYGPVVFSDATGLNHTDLSDKPENSPYINLRYQIAATEDGSWFLKQFKSGRYTIEIGTAYEQKARICELSKAGNWLKIKKVYYKSNYGQTFYDADVMCDGVLYPDVHQNSWGESLITSLSIKES